LGAKLRFFFELASRSAEKIY